MSRSPQWNRIAALKFSLFLKPRAVYLTHWILALIDSLAALVTWYRKYLMMFSNRRFKVLATSSIGRSRLRTAHPCHQRKCLRAGRTALKQRRTLSQSSALSQYILSTIVRDPYDGTTTAGADNNPPMQFALPVEGWRAFFMEIISKDEVDVCSSVSIA